VTEPAVSVHVGELVLDGIDPGDRDAIADALARHLPAGTPAALDPRAVADELARAAGDPAGRPT
jgi:hypothetical protein